MPRHNKRGSFGTEPATTPVSPAPVPPHSSLTPGGARGSDDVSRVTQNMTRHAGGGGGATSDNDEVEDLAGNRDGVSEDGFHADEAFGTGGKSSGSPDSAPLHPGTILAKHKPALQRLEELPGLTVVTWAEFLENPSLLGGLFQVDREDFIHYNPEQVNVFFHDSRMEQPTLGAPSGDGLSWTIFIDSYTHLRSVRTWLCERVSVILLQLHGAKGGHGTAACLVAINPTRTAVGARLQDAFSRATDAFLNRRNVCLEVDLNGCVQTWSRTVLRMPCRARGGRVVITNAEERVPCSRVENVPFCLACFPVWGVRKLSYKYKRQSEYEDILLSFAAEDLSACSQSQSLKQCTENNNNNNSKNKAKPEKQKNQRGQVWMKKNANSTPTSTPTPESADKPDPRGHLEVQEVDSADGGGQERIRRPKPFNSKKRDKERGQDSGFSSDNTSTAERFEPPLSKGVPSYRPHSYVPPRPSDKTRRVTRGHHKNLDDASSTSASTSYASSVVSPGPGHSSSWDPALRAGTPAKSLTSISWQVVEDVEEDDGRDGDFIITHAEVPGPDSRAAEFAQTLAMVQSEGEEGDYMLLGESPSSSPWPDTPYHKPLTSSTSSSLKGRRPAMMTQDDAVITEEPLVNGVYPGDKAQHSHRITAAPPSLRNRQGDFEASKERPSSRFLDRIVHPQAEAGNVYAADNEAFELEDSQTGVSGRLNTRDGDSVQVLKGSGVSSKAFPYTADYLDALGTGKKQSLRYGLVDQDIARGQEFKKKKGGSLITVSKEPADPLFAPRASTHHKHNAQDDIVDDVEDVEDNVSVLSEEEDVVTSPEPTSTTRTNQSTSPRLTRTANVRWELADYDLDEDADNTDSPRILPGALGAQQLRNSREFPAGQNASGGEVWRRGGQQYDSRRRYIALNSLRRKSNQQALQNDLRKAKHAEAPSHAAELIEF